MHFHGLKRMKFLLTPSFNANYLMLRGQKFHGMSPCENGISTSPFKLKKCKQSSISIYQRWMLDGMCLQILSLVKVQLKIEILKLIFTNSIIVIGWVEPQTNQFVVDAICLNIKHY